MRTHLLLLALALAARPAAPAGGRMPLIGSQVWFAPGEVDQPEEIDRIFRTMAEHHMPLARVSLVWNYMERTPGKWDFALFDRVFASAEKHGVRIVATLWPQGKAPFLTGIPDTEEHLRDGERYLAQVVGRYRRSPALDTWIIMNEPGQAPANNPLAMARFHEWLRHKYGTLERFNEAWILGSMVPDRAPYQAFEEVAYEPRWAGALAWPVPALDWMAFWRDHLTWYMRWIAERVRSADPQHPLHVNPQPVTINLATRSFDLPAWRPFLDSLGTSAYPSVTFTVFRPDRFALGFSYLMDVVSGAMEPKPAWLTELPAGNILYSHSRPLYPGPRDIAQWLWTSIGAGAERCLFWLFNARWKARETGEFGMLDFLGEPTERLETASSIARAIEANASFFASARPLDSPVTLILSLESMALHEQWKTTVTPARDRDAQVQCALGFYEVLHELGVPARVKHMHDFDWESPRSEPQLVILPHVSAITAAQAAAVERFVRAGNTVLATGLTGFYDPQGAFWPLQKRFPLEDLFGARPRETRTCERDCTVDVAGGSALPAQTWITSIAVKGAEVVGRRGDLTTAIRHRAGKGEVVWIPSMVGMGAYLQDRKPLAQFLARVAAPFAARVPVRFAGWQPGCLMRVLRSGSEYLTAITNSGTAERRIPLQVPAGAAPRLVWGDGRRISPDAVTLGPKETLVAIWK